VTQGRGRGEKHQAFFGNAVRGAHFEKSLPACIVAAQERAEEKIKGKIEAFWWDSAFLTKNPSKSVSK
jgi:hypothetical protein